MLKLDRRRLFLDTLRDMRERLAVRDEYQTLGLAALLRKLLLDEAPLVDLVNRETQLRNRYKILRPRGPLPGLPVPEFWAAGVALDPASEFPFGTPQNLTKPQFLATPIIYTKKHKINVGDFVSFQAHIAGAVHVQEPKYEKDEELVALVYTFQQAFGLFGAKGVDIAGQQLRAIASVTVAALAELETTVSGQLSSNQE